MATPKQRAPKSALKIQGVFLLLLLFNFAFWIQARQVLPAWDNVPPAPARETSPLVGLGDEEVAYRLLGYSIQNFGNVGGKYESLRDYDYSALKQWFFAAQSLDPESNYVPFLAAYYYGAVEDRPQLLSHVVDYLAEEGQAPYPQKWRWLAHAVYLARYKLNDLPRALALAEIVSRLPGQDVAPWARQLPAFVQLQMGNKQASYEFMARMLASEHDKVHPNEANEMIRFICTRALEPGDAAQNPLCQKTP